MNLNNRIVEIENAKQRLKEVGNKIRNLNNKIDHHKFVEDKNKNAWNLVSNYNDQLKRGIEGLFLNRSSINGEFGMIDRLKMRDLVADMIICLEDEVKEKRETKNKDRKFSYINGKILKYRNEYEDLKKELKLLVEILEKKEKFKFKNSEDKEEVSADLFLRTLELSIEQGVYTSECLKEFEDINETVKELEIELKLLDEEYDKETISLVKQESLLELEELNNNQSSEKTETNEGYFVEELMNNSEE